MATNTYNNYSNPSYYRSLSIPIDIREDVQEAVNRNRNAMRLPHTDIVYLFEVYNRYIAYADEPESIDCGACRAHVWGRMRNFVDLWEQYGMKPELKEA